jgi:hypothetical protein
MDFVKKHYEKILLSVVLLGLAGALVFLPVLIVNDQEAARRMKEGIISVHVDPLPALNLTRETNVSARLQSPYKLDFSTTNKLFNPLQWQKTADGRLIKLAHGDEVGLAVVTKITPLYLVVTLDSIETNELGARYVISLERQAAVLPAQRGKRQHFASVGEKVGEKNDGFIIKEVNGSPADPGKLKLILQLADTGERVTLAKDAPFHRVDAYSADLKYDLERPPRTWQGQRIGADLKFAGDDNIIVAISQDTVILLAKSNQKKTTLTYTPSP